MKNNNFAVRAIETILVAGFIIFEELIWNVLAKPIIQALNQLAIFAKIRRLFLMMDRNLVLVVFLLILVITEYLGILSGVTIVSGQIELGVVIYLLKVPLAAFTFWLFELTKPKLMSFAWLKSAYDYLMHWKGLLTATDIYKTLTASLSATRSRLKTIYKDFVGDQSLLGAVKMRYTLVRSYFIRPHS